MIFTEDLERGINGGKFINERIINKLSEAEILFRRGCKIRQIATHKEYINGTG